MRDSVYQAPAHLISYDGDESAGKLANQMELNLHPEPSVALAPTITDQAPADVKEIIKSEQHENMPDQNQYTHSNGHNGTTAGSWNDGMEESGQGNSYSDGAMEPESHMIGIKEDG